MCFFPQYQINKKIGKYTYNIDTSCGGCPECLSKRSRIWALRCAMEAKTNIGFMCTLTYDEFERDKNGKIIGEKKKDYSDMTVSKRDCQLFIKRLRKYYFGSSKSNLSYMLTAEYGARSGRPHYHAIIFGIIPDDLIPYKKSKRGNQIYMSDTFTKIWNNGICTIDSVNINSAVALYCSKYCAKDSGRAQDTFMLFSRGIGRENLLKEFNGKSYVLEGREYPIPRTIWHEILSKRYNIDFRYVNKPKDDLSLYYSIELERKLFEYPVTLHDTSFNRDYEKWLFCSPYYRDSISPAKWRICKTVGQLSEYYRLLDIVNSYNESVVNRKYALYKKHNDKQYRDYLKYWEKIALRSKKVNGDKVFSRILALDNEKYYGYKQFALNAFNSYSNGKPVVPPRSNSLSFTYHEQERRRSRTRLVCLFPQNYELHTYYQAPFAVPPLVYKRQMTPKKQTFAEKVAERQKNIHLIPLKQLQDPFELMYNNYVRQINIFEV